MNNIITFPDRNRILEEAGAWLVRLDAGPPSRKPPTEAAD